MSKKLSVAILTYNRAAYLVECVTSMLNQTFQDFDIFVFDDASNQPVEQELTKLNDKRVHFIGSEKHMGAEENMNRILQYPFDSEYLTMFNDDDAMHPKLLELQVSFLDRNQDVVFAAAGFNRVYDNHISTFSSVNESNIQYVVYKSKGREFVKAVMSWLTFPTSATMYRLQAIKGSKWEFEQFSDFLDLIFLMKTAKKGDSVFIDAPLVNYRLHVGQYSKVPKKGYEQGAIHTIAFVQEHFSESSGKEDLKLLRRYSLNFLLRAYADINRGFFDFLRFIKRCRREGLIVYSDFKYIDIRGIVSMVSIVLKNKRIIGIIRWMKDLFPL